MTVPKSILMPDSPVRQERWYQLFNRLARPTHDWLVAGGVGWAVLFGPAFHNPLNEGYLVQVLLYGGATFGVRTLERIKGVA
jgi:hypothetical protein